MRKFPLVLAVWASCLAGQALQAVTVPYTENFANDNADWRTNITPNFMTFVASSGPDGSSYASAPFSFSSSAAGDSPVLHRANSGASGNNFFGNWIADGVKEFRAYVRHDASVPLTYFARFADPVGFPGFIVGGTTSVLPNTWTQIEFIINRANPNNFDEGFPFDAVFDNIGRVQLGVFVPEALVGTGQTFAFDLDQVTVDVPEPASIGLCLLSFAYIVTGRRGRLARSLD